ncbi:MAG: MarR family transcriptional regulator [Propionibacteriaceae bacterium]|jgi:DNA-binding MarR family transcriptional regulator|nr:MarR family transcriptional regulator [Propionibacteriaceae bacterium]
MGESAPRERLLEDFSRLREEFEQGNVARHIDALVSLPVTNQQLHVLGFLVVGGPRRASEVARLLDVSGATVSGLLDRLEAAGLVERTVAPEDGRGRLAAATPTGIDVVRQLTAASVPPLVEVIDRVNDADLAAFVQGLRAFLAAFREAWQEGTLTGGGGGARVG